MPASDDSTSLDWELLSGPRSFSACPLISGDTRFQSKVIVITGAGGQLGREGCRYFAMRGAKIAALDLSAAALTGTYQCIATDFDGVGGPNNGSCDFKPYVCDVTNADAVDAVISHVTKRLGGIDLLWNNAGYQGEITPILTMNVADFSSVMNINVTGMFIVLQAVARRMVEQDKKEWAHDGERDYKYANYAIVNTASVAGLRGTPAMAGYASSKAAVIALSVAAAKELAVHGIRCNAVSPALIGPGPLWERQNELHAAVGPPYFAETAAAVAEAKIGQVPMKRLGTPDEVVKSVAFLLSDDASYTTGINLTVDGGMAAGLKA